MEPITVDGIVPSSLVVRFGVVNRTDATCIPADDAATAIRVIDDATLNANNLFIANRAYPGSVMEVWGSRMNVNGGSVVRPYSTAATIGSMKAASPRATISRLSPMMAGGHGKKPRPID